MSTVCVFIIGTNAVGKTTLAKNLIRKYGGIKHSSTVYTTLNDDRVAMAGLYEEGRKICGVDKIQAGTKALKDVAEQVWNGGREILIAEGMLMHTFGLNLTNAMFTADKHLVIFLWCPVSECLRRLRERTENARFKQLASHFKAAARTAKKWQQIGVPVLTFDSSQVSPEDICEQVYNKIEQLWSSE